MRHTNRDRHQEHVDAYAEILLTKPVKRAERDPAALAEANDLLALLDNHFWAAYNGLRTLPTDDDRDQYMGENTKSQNWNEGTSAMLALVGAVKWWAAANSTALTVPAGFTVVGDNDSDGDSVYLHCQQCAPEEMPYAAMDAHRRVGTCIGRFQTNHWDDPPTVATLADLVTAAREHNQEVHGGEAV